MSNRELRMVDVDSLRFAGSQRNVKTYVGDLINSFRKYGYQAGHPLTVLAKSDGRHLVQSGCRRALALRWLQQNESATFRRILPHGKIPAIVVSEQEHTDRIILVVGDIANGLSFIGPFDCPQDAAMWADACVDLPWQVASVESPNPGR